MSERQPAATIDVRIPLVIGVTGHRNLRDADDAAIRESVREELRKLLREYKHTPLLLISALAEGGDLLCAEVALEMDIPVRAPLPFPAQDYLSSGSFTSEKSKERFAKAMADPRVEHYVAWPVDEPWPGTDGWAKITADKTLRDRAYATVGAEVVAQSHLLMALWDGDLSKPAGVGTLGVLNYSLTGQPIAGMPPRAPLSQTNNLGPVIVIGAPREKSVDSGAQTRVGQARWVYPIEPRELIAGLDGQDLPHFWKDHFPDDDLDPEKAHGHFEHRRCDYANLRRLLEGRASAEDECQQTRSRRLFELVWHQIDEFNERLQAHQSSGAKIESGTAKKLVAKLLPLNEPAVVASDVPDWLLRLAALRRWGGDIANAMGKEVDLANRWGFIGVALGALCFDLYVHLAEADGKHITHKPWLLGAFLICLVFAWGLWTLIHRRKSEEIKLDMRALSEGVRVQFYWHAAGIPESVADHYLMQVRSELSVGARGDFGVYATAAKIIRRAFYRMPDEQRDRVVRSALEGWCTEQHNYFRKAYPKQRWRNEQLERWGFLVAKIGWLIAGGFFMVWAIHQTSLGGARLPVAAPTTAQVLSELREGQERGAMLPDAKDPGDWPLTVSALLVVAGGLMLAYKERQFYAEQSRQYERMYGLFRNALTILHQIMESKDPAMDAKKRMSHIVPILLTLGREALSENASWLILHRARPAELMVL